MCSGRNLIRSAQEKARKEECPCINIVKVAAAPLKLGTLGPHQWLSLAAMVLLLLQGQR